MAKLSARGATVVGRAKVSLLTSVGPSVSVFALRSDGKILRKFHGDSGYSIAGSLKAGVPVTLDTLLRVLARRGLDVVSSTASTTGRI